MDRSKYFRTIIMLGAPDDRDSVIPADIPGWEGQVFGWWQPVFDRTEADCVYGVAKGALDAVFLNRCEANVDWIRFQTAKLLLPVAGATYKSDAWTRKLYIRVGEFNRIQQNILNIRSTGPVASNTPTFYLSAANVSVPYEVANAMEKILYDIYLLLKGSGCRKKILGRFTLGNNYEAQVIRR